MKFESALIVTYGRSGSTLLQGVLNAMPGCLVRGENYNFCHGLYQAWSALSRTRGEFGSVESSKPEHPWYGADALDPDAFIAGMRPMVRAQLISGLGKPPKCLGFKEIRYLSGTLGVSAEHYPARLHDYLGFLARLMPKPAFIFLTRDHDQVANSAWWKGMEPARVKAALAAFEAQALPWKHELAGTFHIDYADVVSQGPRVAALFEFMGARYDAEAVKAVLSREHSFGNNRGDGAPNPEVGGKDRGQMVTQGAPRAAAALNGSGLHPEVLPLPPGVLRVMTDPLPDKPVAPDTRLRWNGVVVAAGSPKGLKLQLILPDGKPETVAWGIDSPRMALELPQEPSAAKARYKTPEFSLAPGQQCELQLVGPQGAQPLWRLKRPSAA